MDHVYHVSIVFWAQAFSVIVPQHLRLCRGALKKTWPRALRKAPTFSSKVRACGRGLVAMVTWIMHRKRWTKDEKPSENELTTN